MGAKGDFNQYQDVVLSALPRQLWRGSAVRLIGNWLQLVAAAKARRRIPFWAAPVLAALPLWGVIYVASVQPPPAKPRLPSHNRGRPPTARGPAKQHK